MRHRIGNIITGIGNSSPILLDNKGEFPEVLKEPMLNSYFKKYEYFDFSIGKDYILAGVEPAYQHEELRIICINKKKINSYIHTGKSFGHYGSGIKAKKKFYFEYQNKCKFVSFIDKWHEELFGKDL